MNDETLDELLSAAIDGTASPDELALIAQNPSSEQRLAQLRSAADAVSSPLPRVTVDRRHAMIAAAVDSFVPAQTAPQLEAPHVATKSVGPSNVVPFRPLRARLRSGSAVVGGIAASIVAMAMLANVIGSGLKSSSNDASSTAEAPVANTAAALESAADAVADGSNDQQATLSAEAPAATNAAAATTTPPSSDEDMTLESDGSGRFDSAETTQPSEEFLRTQALVESCWESTSALFPDQMFDEDAEAVIEDALLKIPTLGNDQSRHWIVLDPNSCEFEQFIDRP